MAVFRRRGRRNFDVEPTIPGLGRLGRFSAGRADERTARAMETALHELAVTGFADLLEQLRERAFTLPELYTAKLTGRPALEALRRRRSDPPLALAVAELRGQVADARVRTGLDQLLALAPTGARLSWLLEPPHLSEIYGRAVANGRKPNTVRRGLHRAVSDLLTARFGRGRMLAIMAETRVPDANDERDATLTAAELQKLLEACDDEFRPVVEFAVLTGIDRGPLLALRVRDYDEASGVLHVPDTKTPFRSRRIDLGEEAARCLRTAGAGKPSDERVFGLSYHQVRKRWEAARRAIGRTDVRFKDLRGIFATSFLAEGGDPRQLQLILGHSSMAMTLRYLRRLPAKGGPHMDAAAVGLGLRRGHLRVRRGGRAGA